VGDFERDTAVQSRGNGSFDCFIAEDWWVVAGPNGGYLAAIVARALLAADGAGRPLRSLTVHYLRAPSAGPARVEVELERRGRTVTFASARLVQAERTCALALTVLADSREGLELEHAAPPAVAPPEELDEASNRPDPPPVARQLRFRPALDGGAGEALTGGWLRLRRDAPLDAALLVALCDFWLPAAFTVAREPIAVPTLELTVHLRALLPLESDWVLGRFVTRTAREGLLEEDAELWSRDGTLLAQSRQLALSLGGSPGAG
jgi:acyl-CoA thioesterase